MGSRNSVGKASGEETGIEETMEAVVTTVEAMTSVVEAVDVMVTIVEMKEWLEVGWPETERTVAVRFFSRALAPQEPPSEEEKTPNQVRPPWHLPGLVLLLQDCLLPHNSEAIQSGTMLSLKHLVCLCPSPPELIKELHGESRVPEHLFRLARESDYTEIREQALWLLSGMSRHWCHMFRKDPENPPTTTWNLDFMPLLTDLVRKYAAVQEPTDADLFSLNRAIQALTLVAWNLNLLEWDSETLYPQMLEILPVIIGILKEPGKHKSVQMLAAEFLAIAGRYLDGNDFLESGMIEMVSEMLRVRKESTAILIKALRVLLAFLTTPYYRHNTGEVTQKVLDMGILDAIHHVLKRPNDSLERERRRGNWVLERLWEKALRCLVGLRGTAESCEAILNQPGLIEWVLETALGMDMSQETTKFHTEASTLLHNLAGLLAHTGSTRQVRRLLLSGPLFPLLSRYLNEPYDHSYYDCELCLNLGTVGACLKLPGSLTDKRIVRRLIDSAGITDVLRRISDYSSESDSEWENCGCADLAQHILDTYLNDPLPPTPPNNLPAIIYTRNVSS